MATITTSSMKLKFSQPFFFLRPSKVKVKLSVGDVVSFTHGRFATGGKSPVTHWIGGSVDPRAGLDDMQK
jgi:hypothetical protein